MPAVAAFVRGWFSEPAATFELRSPSARWGTRRSDAPRRLRVVAVLQETPTVRSYVLESADEARPLHFRAGQHLTLLVAIDGVTHRRCYSFSTAPGAGARGPGRPRGPPPHPAPILRGPHPMQAQRAHPTRGAAKPALRHATHLTKRHRQNSPSRAGHPPRFPRRLKPPVPSGPALMAAPLGTSTRNLRVPGHHTVPPDSTWA